MRRSAGRREVAWLATVGSFFHWAKVAAEVARLSPKVEMDIAVLRAVVIEKNRPS